MGRASSPPIVHHNSHTVQTSAFDYINYIWQLSIIKMSQDTGLFSVRRPRETLGGINYNSNIPQPASAMKRSNSMSGPNMNAPFTVSHVRSISGSRASLAPPRPNQPQFQRSSSGTNLAEMGTSSVKRTSFQNTSSRKSF